MSRELKVLLLEDSAEDAELIKRQLRSLELICDVKTVCQKAAYLQALESFHPDIILSDHALPEFDSLHALKLARQHYPSIPFIMVTGTVSEEFAANIIKSGADDYILKDRMTRLPTAVSSVLKQRENEKISNEAVREAREKMEMAEEWERLAIEAANLGIYDYDILNDAIVTSHRYNEIFGFDESKKIKDYIAVLHPEDYAVRDKAYAESVITNRLHYEARITRSDGRLMWIKVDGIIYRDENGNPERIIGSIMDITDVKLLLEQKDTFIAVASHELKTPVTTINVYLHMLLEDLTEKGDVREVKLIKNVNAQVSRLITLINRLLDSTRIISGNLVYVNSAFHFDQLVRQVAQTIRLTSEKKIHLQLLARKAMILADKEKIEQVISNLILNAIKFSPSSDQIIVRSFVKDTYVHMEVQDYGIGIKKENIEKIFRQFYRENNDFKYTFPGLGLGLFISDEIIKQAGGKISVTSTEGEGSVFAFALPKAPAANRRMEAGYK